MLGTDPRREGPSLRVGPALRTTIGDYDPNRLGQGFDDFVAWRGSRSSG